MGVLQHLSRNGNLLKVQFLTCHRAGSDVAPRNWRFFGPDTVVGRPMVKLGAFRSLQQPTMPAEH